MPVVNINMREKKRPLQLLVLVSGSRPGTISMKQIDTVILYLIILQLISDHTDLIGQTSTNSRCIACDAVKMIRGSR